MTGFDDLNQKITLLSVDLLFMSSLNFMLS